MACTKTGSKNDLFLNCRRKPKELSKKELSNVAPSSLGYSISTIEKYLKEKTRSGFCLKANYFGKTIKKSKLLMKETLTNLIRRKNK